MPKLIDLTGQRFGRLKVLARDENDKHGNSAWLCHCNCGNEVVVLGMLLAKSSTKSCGCLRIEKARKRLLKHGMYGTTEYTTWQDMKSRCNNKKGNAFKNYGGRGIKVCKRWEYFGYFLKDMGFKPHKRLTLERVDNNKGYSPENCIWATYTTQMRNKRIHTANTTGVSGVTWKKQNSKYLARITVNYNSIFLGYFDCLEDAVLAREQGELKYWRCCDKC